jgi:hypothetical protein
MTFLVRDEIDIVAATLDYHFAHGVDFVVAMDNGSVDGTREILGEYERRGLLCVLDQAPSDFSQHRWVTGMALMAYLDHRADWVMHVDADELFVPREAPDLKHVLARVAPETGVLSIGRHDFVPFDRPRLAPPQREMIYRKAISLNMRGLPLPPKVIHRGVKECAVAQGNHAVRGPELGAPLPFADISVYHYPLRDYPQFLTKVINGGTSYAINRELPKDMGQHKRRWYEQLQQGQLEDVYRNDLHYDAGRLVRELADGRIVIDRAAASFYEE